MSENISRRGLLGFVAGGTAAGLLMQKSVQAEYAAESFANIMDFGAAADGATDDTPAFKAALDAATAVYVPPGTYIVQLLSIPSHRKLFGAGETSVIKTAGAPRSFGSEEGASHITLSGFTIEGHGLFEEICPGEDETDTRIPNQFFGISFKKCEYLCIENLTITQVPGYGIELDGCRYSDINSIRVINSGRLCGYSGITLNFNSKQLGECNSISRIYGENNHGRLVTLFGQYYSHVSDVIHRARSGEALLMEDCQGCTGKMISQIGGKYDPVDNPNGLSDGVALNGNCKYCELSDILCANNAGHGVSINGHSGKEGASYNVVSNIRVVNPDEGGVIVTDQGVVGSVPSSNLISNCYVENASANNRGAEYESEAYAAVGAIENQFINCYAKDSRPAGQKKTLYGYRETHGKNTANANHFDGVLSGEFLKGIWSKVGVNSTVEIRKSISD